MNRLQHFLRAQTQYGLHSPFVYRLYTEVLFSRAGGRGRSFADVVWRLEEYYGLPHPDALLNTRQLTLDTRDGLFLVVDRPHRDEASWQSLCNDGSYQVTLDLYDVGIAVSSPRLSRQHFVLR